MIKCLPTEVQGKLRSGVAIPSLQQCVEELVLNSIDAGATCVGVRIDMEAFKVQVIDNGSGMTSEDMENVGIRYHTSKCSCVEDLENLRFHGFRGEALASIVSLATLVEISSRSRLSVKTHVKMFKDGQGMAVFEGETARPSAGTTVIICNFFHNMPVRRKRVDVVLEGERIRQRVEAVSLMHPSVSFTLKNDCTGTMMVQLPKARDTYHRFVQIHNLARAEKLGEISHTHKQFQVTGYLGKEGHYNNSLQYLYVNDRLLLKTRIHKLLNCLLRRLSSSNQKNDSPDGTSVIQRPKHKRNQDLYGVYIINIKCSCSEFDICLEPAKTLVEFKDWDGVLLCIEEAVKAFLRRERLVSLFSQEDVDCVVFGTERTDQKEETEMAGQGAIGASNLDISVGMKLASDFVHRRSAVDSVCLESDQNDSRTDEAQRYDLMGIALNEFKKTPQCDLEPASIGLNDEVKQTVTEAAENLDGQKRQDCGLSKEQETQQSSSDSHLPVSQIPTCQLELNVNKEILQCPVTKIRLSDPYIHQSLKIQNLSQSEKPEFQVQHAALNCEEKFLTSKRKIPLESNSDVASRKPCSDLATVLPSKIPRVNAVEKLSTFEPPGSLDKFRQTYSKSLQGKFWHRQSQNNAHFFQTLSFAKNPAGSSAFQENEQDQDDSKDDDKEQSIFQSPTKLTANYKRSKISSAAKLRSLKQHMAEDVEVRNLSEDKNSLSIFTDVTQDWVNGQNPHNHKVPVEPSLDSSCKHQLDEDGSTCSDWLHHYDTSVGKTVYINTKTGLSRYEEPASEETQVPCTSDVSNMAVSVISEMGMEYRCYPFQLDLVLPFLPRSREGRVVSSGTELRDDANENSLSSLYSKWKNPVFVRPPTVGVDISSGQADGLAVKIHSILFPYRFSKNMIHSMKVVNQVDKKFLACLINARDVDSAAQTDTEGNLLVLVDQHAAHERVRLENLVEDSYEDDPDAAGAKRLSSSTILPPLEISVAEEELRLLRSSQPHLKNLGLEVTFSKTGAPQLFVGKVPLCFMEKESNELRRGRPSVIKPIVEEYLREQTELLRVTGRVTGTLPLTVLKVLASLACHGAIKFNDTLSSDECHSLVASLSSCQLPFQCAHGRPSIVPLVDVLHLDKDQKDFQKPNLRKLRRMYKAWELYGNK
ncbi:DNA mismatch repair protein Mlh3 isoform X1 [Girardinichthys multiradiatus]|uniref:DNA mismatch repair protein Mlh3 isoform X1 n=1 Tax=Girardinichthys multiradiatus TaxID=208333 RepID=UPI001FABA56A|nr:DNA mismatch repair protein Mlh3 isoform X1 [Girardinichthys multiradiatus]XP_047248823.1 DNA mismatch repair protein Mlh3 isoform X1 [Girardinichthys multiradiatus]